MKGILTTLFLFLFIWGTVWGDNLEEDFFAADRAKSRTAFEQLKGQYPGAQISLENGRVSRVYGRSFGNGASPEDAADIFVRNFSPVLSADYNDLARGSLLKDGRDTQPVMYNRETGEYKFTLVYYRQIRDGIPVFRGEARVLVKNEPDYPVVLVSSALRSLNDFKPDKSGIDFNRALFSARDEVPALTDFTEPEVVIWAGYNDRDARPRTAIQVTGYNDKPERWLFVIDAVSGEILFQEDQIEFEDVTGQVRGMVTQGIGAEQCESESPEPFPYARVNIGSTITYTDINGNFTIPYSGTGQVILESRSWGQWFRVYNYGGTDVVLPDTVNTPGPADFMHNQANTSELIRAQANAYVESNVVRDMVVAQNPSYPGMSVTSFPVYVNRTDGYCPGNAWYDPGDESINFCRIGSGYPNTAWGSVLHHEYGHHLVNMAGSGQDQYGEGMGDCIAVTIADDPRLGLGFYGNCTTPLRNADNTMQYPCSDEAHTCAPLLAGCIWDTRSELLAAGYPDYLDIIQNLTVNSILLHTGSLTTPQITIDFLTLDDDDANLENGTPHWSQICAGFGAHNMDCPAMIPILFSYPDGKPDVMEPDQEKTFRVVAGPGGDTPVSGTGVFYYSLNGGSWQNVPMTELTPNEYQAVLPASDCNNQFSWYVSAEASSWGIVTDPSDAPTSVYKSVVADTIFTAFEDNFETDKGWTTSATATAGLWQRGIPAGGGDRGDPPNDFDGSSRCYLTGNTYGDSDVDGGYVYLVSPVFDISTGDAIVNYARWYSNNYGADPNNDLFKVYISGNNGTSWTLVETIGPADQANGGWYENSFLISDFTTPTAQMKLRFEASDLNSGSVVEAGIDAVKISLFQCLGTGPNILTQSLPNWTLGMAYSQQLEAERGVGQLSWFDKNGDLTGTGLSLSSSGLLTGTPATSGSISFIARVVDEEDQDDEQLLSLTINPAITITTVSLPDWTAGINYSRQLTVSGGTGSKTWSDPGGNLAGTGLGISASGVISGVPSVPGVINFTARATDQLGAYGEKLLSFTVNATIDVTTTTIPPGLTGTIFSYQLTASGGTGNRTWVDKNAELLLAGLSLSSLGIITGVPLESGTFQFTAKVTDGVGSTDEQLLSIFINETLNIQAQALDDWTVGRPYSKQLSAVGGSGEVTWSDKNNDLDGTGLTLSVSGLLSGIPLAPGTISFTAVAEDEGTGYDEQVFSFDINPTLAITTQTLPDWTAGRAYSQALQATGGTGTRTWIDKNGDLAGTGLALSSAGQLNGTPAAEGIISFTARVTDEVGDDEEQLLQVTINPAVAITTAEVPDGVQYEAYSVQLEATGGTGALSWIDRYGDLAGTGLTLSSDGLLSGNPGNIETITFSARATDMTGSQSQIGFTFNILPPWVCGDFNGDGDVNILDITAYIDWKYKGGAAPNPLARGDVNNDGAENVLDIVHLIDYKFKSGPAPDCGWKGIIPAKQ